MKHILNIIFFLPVLSAAQLASRDTSFTIMGTYLKEVKTRPYITIASPLLSKKSVNQNDIVYRTVGNGSLKLDIFYPEKTKLKKPVVLLIHGGGWKSGDKNQNQAIATALSNNGFVAVSAEYRLSPEAKYPAAVLDLKSAIRWIRANSDRYGIDTNSIAVLGCSSGGQLASLIGATNKDRSFEDSIGNSSYSSVVHAVINVDGILAFKHPESKEGQSASQWLGGNYEQVPDTWRNASALHYSDSIMIPFLFIISSQPRFHAGMNDMIKKMNSRGIYSEVIDMPDSPHPFWFFHPWFDPMMERVIAFLNKVFKKNAGDAE
jgi:acetyl esterase/lipase